MEDQRGETLQLHFKNIIELRVYLPAVLLGLFSFCYLLGGWYLWLPYVALISYFVLTERINLEFEDFNLEKRLPNQAALYLNYGFVFVNIFVALWVLSPIDILDFSGLASFLVGHEATIIKEGNDFYHLVGLIMSLGMVIGMSGGTIAHELTHRPSGVEKFLSRVLSALSFDVFLMPVAHIELHHGHLATPLDPGTPRRRESLYRFIIRSHISGFRQSWAIEKKRLSEKGFLGKVFGNRIIITTFLSLIYLTIIYLSAGLVGLLIFGMAGSFARTMHDTFNYIQHYGLVRAPGTKIRHDHSWNFKSISHSTLTYNLNRQSHHHVETSKRFWELSNKDATLEIPFGATTSSLLALLPPIWIRLMQPYLDKWDRVNATSEELDVIGDSNKKTTTNPALSNILLLNGRYSFAMDTAHNLKAEGHRIILAESMGYCYGRFSKSIDKFIKVTAPRKDRFRYKKDILKIIKEQEINLVIGFMEESFFLSEFVDQIPCDIKVIGDHVTQHHHKGKFARYAQQIGLKTPFTMPLSQVKSDQLKDLFPEGVVLKKAYSQSGINVEILTHLETIDLKNKDPDQWIVQKFIEGRPISAFNLCEKGKILIHSSYENHLTYNGSVGIAHSKIANTKVLAWCETFVKETNLSGFVSFDFIQDKYGEVWAIECNPRATSGLLLVPPKDLVIGLTGMETGVDGLKKRGKEYAPKAFNLPAALMGIWQSPHKGAYLKEILEFCKHGREININSEDIMGTLLIGVQNSICYWKGVFTGKSILEIMNEDIEWQPSESILEETTEDEAHYNNPPIAT